MQKRTGGAHSAAGAHAQPDDGTDVPVVDSLELLVDAELEKLNAIVGPPPALEREPEVLGGCSCGAVFYTYEAADEHPDRCRFSIGPFGEAVRP
jgi:hypothetical protein